MQPWPDNVVDEMLAAIAEGRPAPTILRWHESSIPQHLVIYVGQDRAWLREFNAVMKAAGIHGLPNRPIDAHRSGRLLCLVVYLTNLSPRARQALDFVVQWVPE